MKNVAVFFGGASVEHDISIITGVLTTNAVDSQKYNVIPIYVDLDGKFYTGENLRDLDNFKSLNKKLLKEITFLLGSNKAYIVKGKKLKPLCEIAVAINCMHGERGEDGSLAGFLKMLSIPLASPDVLPSAVCMDKCFTKIAMRGLRVKTLPYVTMSSREGFSGLGGKLKFPVVVKPACLGSSIGIMKAENVKELERAYSYAMRYGENAIVEPLLKNFIEINCGAYRANGKINVSECERPIGRTEFLSFDDKYRVGKREFPANIEKEISDKIKAITEKVYENLCFDGVIRIDYFVVNGEIYLNEINTVPGSLAYYLFSKTVSDYGKMLNELIRQAEINFSARSTVQKRYDTGILNMKGCKGKNACKK